MKLVLTLSEALHNCNDWDTFCDEAGLDVYCCANGYGDTEISIPVQTAFKYKIIKDEN